MRRDFLGIGMCPEKTAVRMLPAEAGKQRFADIGELPLRPIPLSGDHPNARALTVPEDAVILFRYEDGGAAAYTRKVGEGEVIVFGAMPFQDSELADADSGWNGVFRALIDERGIARDLPIWKFSFPEAADEVETFDLLVK